MTIADAATGDRVAEAGDRNGDDTAALRAVLGSFASGVTVVTTAVDGWLHGMTANAFSSLSLDPPLVLVCVRKTARMHGLIERGGAFAVNILSEGQEETARYFATRGRPAEAEFAAIPHVAGVLGLPLLLGTAGRLECQLHAAHDGGDHTIYVGLVVQAQADPQRRPLLYHQGQYVSWPVGDTEGDGRDEQER